MWFYDKEPLGSCTKYDQEYALDFYSWVDEFVDRACASDLPLGFPTYLFLYFALGREEPFKGYNQQVQAEFLNLKNAFNGSCRWAQAQVIGRMRKRLYRDQHVLFCQAAESRAKEDNRLREAIDGKEDK